MHAAAAVAVVLLLLAPAAIAQSGGRLVSLDADPSSPYAVLGLPPTASVKEVRDRYHEMALRFHPDKAGGGETSSEQFVALVEAYEAAVELAGEHDAVVREAGGPATGAPMAVMGEAKVQTLVMVVHSSPHPNPADCMRGGHLNNAAICSSHGRWRWASRWIGPEEGNIVGGGEDSHGPYTVHGTYNVETGMCRWKKHYLEEIHDVVFVGSRTGEPNPKP
eukprot:CAMPEP_0182854470 /NCGR_PEP_ID=MMETSP0034_2-20130328/1272_1 /TAXON_ID=156128 /ORGANISM="Nephroselmis pyriformis, Strain CCMP717" /LENGTH=219 /DNA_ID=CAMNT_0024985303 /DNA_START=318 /DNA_END=977 /DNA_ORIENTATION=+